ncbi:MAG: PAS domain S-box-containing protein [Halovenus sp.]|jgi:PAS domain S-box-containing protein
MIEESPAEGVEFDTETGSETAVVYPLVADSGNRRVLTDWLADHESYRLPDEMASVTETTCDLYIVDQTAFQRHRDELDSVKGTAEPALLPVLLLVSEWESEIVRRDRGEIADNVLVATIDEIVSTPIRQVELEWRMQALLRLRAQSLELREKQERLRLFRRAAEAAGNAIYITNTDGVIQYVNPAFEEITGYSRGEVLGETPGLLNSGEMPEGFYETVWETVSAGEVWEGEVVDRRRDGEEYIAYQTVAPIADDGEVNAFVTVQTDITERTEMRRELERHRDIVERLDDPIMLQDREGNFELLNEAVADYAGVPKERLRDEDEFLFMDEETAARIDRRKQEVLETEEPADYGVRPTFELEGDSAAFSTSRYPYYDTDDTLAGTIAICRNVTDLEERTRQLQVIDTVLRHNLRNSLTVIGLLAERVRSQTEGELATTADRIVQNARDLRETGEKSRAITDVLANEPTGKPVDTAEAVRSVADTVTAEYPDVELSVETPERAVAGVTPKIDEAIEELARNALAHNDSDQPAVELRVDIDDEVTVSVADNGPGMAEMDRDVLERGAAVEDLYHGSGLGLWLVYWVVERSGGSVTVSDTDRGTKVTVSLPEYTGETGQSPRHRE